MELGELVDLPKEFIISLQPSEEDPSFFLPSKEDFIIAIQLSEDLRIVKTLGLAIVISSKGGILREYHTVYKSQSFEYALRSHYELGQRLSDTFDIVCINSSFSSEQEVHILKQSIRLDRWNYFLDIWRYNRTHWREEMDSNNFIATQLKQVLTSAVVDAETKAFQTAADMATEAISTLKGVKRCAGKPKNRSSGGYVAVGCNKTVTHQIGENWYCPYHKKEVEAELGQEVLKMSDWRKPTAEEDKRNREVINNLIKGQSEKHIQNQQKRKLELDLTGDEETPLVNNNKKVAKTSSLSTKDMENNNSTKKDAQTVNSLSPKELEKILSLPSEEQFKICEKIPSVLKKMTDIKEDYFEQRQELENFKREAEEKEKQMKLIQEQLHANTQELEALKQSTQNFVQAMAETEEIGDQNVPTEAPERDVWNFTPRSSRKSTCNI